MTRHPKGLPPGTSHCPRLSYCWGCPECTRGLVCAECNGAILVLHTPRDDRTIVSVRCVRCEPYDDTCPDCGEVAAVYPGEGVHCLDCLTNHKPERRSNV